MGKGTIIKLLIALSVILCLYLGLGIQRQPEGNGENGICGEWRYQDDSDTSSSKWYLDISESGSGVKYDLNIYETASEEPCFIGYMVVDSSDNMTIHYKDGEEIELPESWKRIENVQKFSYAIKNKLLSQDELYITYEDDTNNFTLMFTREGEAN